MGILQSDFYCNISKMSEPNFSTNTKFDLWFLDLWPAVRNNSEQKKSPFQFKSNNPNYTDEPNGHSACERARRLCELHSGVNRFDHFRFNKIYVIGNSFELLWDANI